MYRRSSISAAMREAMIKLAAIQGDQSARPAELAIDHSVQVDEYGSADSLNRNNEMSS